QQRKVLELLLPSDEKTLLGQYDLLIKWVMEHGNRSNEAMVSEKAITIGKHRYTLFIENRRLGTWFNLLEGNTIIGFIHFRQEGFGKVADFGGAWVDPKRRQEGYGEQLFKIYFEHLKENGLEPAEDALTIDDPYVKERY